MSICHRRMVWNFQLGFAFKELIQEKRKICFHSQIYSSHFLAWCKLAAAYKRGLCVDLDDRRASYECVGLAELQEPEWGSVFCPGGFSAPWHRDLCAPEMEGDSEESSFNACVINSARSTSEFQVFFISLSLGIFFYTNNMLQFAHCS